MSSDSAPPPPDYTPLINASTAASQLDAANAAAQLDWAKKTYADNQGKVDAIWPTIADQIDRQNQASIEDRQRTTQIYQPLEDKQAAEAADWSSPERQEVEAGKAEADVAQSMSLQRDNAEAHLQGYGVDPGQLRNAALDRQAGVAGAAAGAAAGNTARTAVQTRGDALLANAVNVGRGYPAQVTGEITSSQQGGNAGVNQGLATAASGSQTMGSPVQYGALSAQNLGAAGNFMNAGFNDALQSWKAGQGSSSGIGSIAGTLGGALISKLPMFAAAGGKIPPPNPSAPGQPQPAQPAIPMGADGTQVPASASPSNGAVTDDVPAQLNAGEFIIPKDVVSWLGERGLQKIVEQARTQMTNHPGPAQPGQGPPTSNGPPAVDTTQQSQQPAIPMGA